jgi:hypothetical protein
MSTYDDPYYAHTPQANVQNAIGLDITTPGALMPQLIRIDNLLNLDTEPLDVGCPVCGSWTTALADDGTCFNPLCPTNAKTAPER